MAVKKCPSCGKKIASAASYCIFCSARFDDIPTEEVKEEPVAERSSRKKIVRKWCLILLPVVFVLSVAVVLTIVFVHNAGSSSHEEPTPTTVTTRDPARDAWLQEYLGRWVDETSVGKKSLEKQGGAMLFVHTIQHDMIEFDLLSYSGGEISKIASVSGVRAIMKDDTLHFTFKNDTQGHSGEGYLRFRDGEIDLEVLIDEERYTHKNDYSLAMNTVFKRVSLPQSVGLDLRSLDSLDAIKKVLGDPVGEPTVDEKTKNKTYSFGALTANTDKDGRLLSICADYRAMEDKTQFCFECIDGTMEYQTVKAYFGEALHDYVEQPTNIRVLYYAFENNTETQFTFDAQNNLLIKILYHQEIPTTTAASTAATTTTSA